MILSSDEMEILEYLKSWNGTSISMIEICRCAGGRRKFRETPHWAKGLMARLVESNLIQVNERGHYCFVVEGESKPTAASAEPIPETQAASDNYFPADKGPGVVGEDYFPAPAEPEPKPNRWVSPQMAAILLRAGKKLGRQQTGG